MAGRGRHGAVLKNGRAWSEIRAYGPRQASAVDGGCPCCGKAFEAGDFTCHIPLGPGTDAEERRRAVEGRFFNAVAIEVHFACATGQEVPQAEPLVSERYDVARR